MEYTSCFSLQTQEGKQVGFMLGSTSFQGEAGECVFMLLPAEAGLVDSPLGVVVAGLKVSGEHGWRRHGASLRVHLGGDPALEITDGSLVLDASSNVIGKAVPVPGRRQPGST
jgi:hypothetical protein